VGGKGTRLYPLTLFQSKPLVPIVNYPIFMRMLEVLARQGVRRFIFGSRGIGNTLQLKDVLRYGAGFSRKLSLPYQLQFMYQPNYRDAGSADAVRYSMEYYEIGDEVLVVSGDNIADIQLKDIIDFHRAKGAVATVVLKELDAGEDISQFGVAELDGDSRVVGFIEKPGEGECTSRLINSSIYLFSPEILEILREMGERARDIGADLMPYLVSSGYPVYGYRYGGYWADVGAPDNFLKTSLDILGERVENIRFRKEDEYDEGIWVHPSTSMRFDDGAPELRRNTFIGGDCSIHRTAIIENSSIGDNCIIDEDVEIRNSVVMDFVNIEEGARLNGCIIGRYATIGGGSVIDGEMTVEVSGRKERTPVVGSGVHIARNSTLGAYKRVAPIATAHRILKTGRFVALGYDERNIYFMEK